MIYLHKYYRNQQIHRQRVAAIELAQENASYEAAEYKRRLIAADVRKQLIAKGTITEL